METTGSCGLSATVIVKCCASCAFFTPRNSLVIFPRGKEPPLASRKAVISATLPASRAGGSSPGAFSPKASVLGRFLMPVPVAALCRLTMRSGSPSSWQMLKCGVSCAFFKPRNCLVNLPSDTEPSLFWMNEVTSASRAGVSCSMIAGSCGSAVPRLGSASGAGPMPKGGPRKGGTRKPGPRRPRGTLAGRGVGSTPPCSCTTGPWVFSWTTLKCFMSCAFFTPGNCLVSFPSATGPPFVTSSAVISASRRVSRGGTSTS
mmetsp:Transcript_50721/g.117782  ORF Transcript_50721/g.117782 Transcript_50721/m.117782 type:complete len:260 (+) Transcript_50721:220-999(+)